MALKEKLEKRAELIAEARKITDKAETEKRKLSDEESAKFDSIIDEAQEIKDSIDRENRMLKAGEEVELAFEKTKAELKRGGNSSGEIKSNLEVIDSKEYRSAIQKYLKGSLSALTPEEHRSLSQGSASDGGYLVPAEQFVANLLKKVDDIVRIRSLATVYKLNKAVSLGVPSLETNIADADWTSEIGTGSEDTAMAFGKRALFPAALAKLVKISDTLLRNSPLPVEQIVMDNMAMKFGVTEEKGFLTGNGASQALGVFTASVNGISTGRDVSTDNTSTAITVDGLINAKFALKEQYMMSPKTAWMFHRDAVRNIAKLKDSTNQYLWEQSIRAGQPDTLLGFPVYMSEFVPNTFTTGLYVGILGDFSYYWIAESLEFRIQRLNELYAATNQVGFIGRREVDGMPALEEAFVRVKLA